jgi:hypothetical protein
VFEITLTDNFGYQRQSIDTEHILGEIKEKTYKLQIIIEYQGYSR